MMWWLMGACVASTWLSGYAFNSILSRRWPMAWGDRLLFALPIGIGWIIWMAFFCSEFLSIPITRLFVIGMTVPPAILGLVWFVKDGMGWFAEYKTRMVSGQDSWTWIAWCILGVIGLLTARQILESWFTPVFNTDAFMYHLPFAKIIYQTHALPQYASLSYHDVQYAFPPFIFIWYAVVWLWCDIINLFAAPLTVLIFVIHTCFLVYRLARKILEVEPAAALGAVLCLFLPGTFTENIREWQSSSDFPYVFWCICAVYWFLLDIQYKQAGYWVWVGICGAMCYWTKPLGLIFGAGYAAIMFGSYLVNQFRSYTQRPFTLPYILKVGLVSIGLLLPLLMRSWLLWGNPFYPAFLSQLGGYMVNAWSLKYNWFVTPFSPDLFTENHWEIILINFIGESAVALTLPLLFISNIYRKAAVRTCILIALAYIGIYMLTLGIEPGVTIETQKGHARYLMVSSVLLGILIAYHLSLKNYLKQSQLSIALAVSIVLITAVEVYKLYAGLWELPDINSLNTIKIIAYDQISLITLAGLFIFGLSGHGRHWTRFFKLSMISLSCLFLSIAWPVSAPWRMISQPMGKSPVDWTHITMVIPHGPWMDQHLPKSAVLLTHGLEMGTWIVPRQMVSVTNPIFERLFDPQASLKDQLHMLAEKGVTHILAHGRHGTYKALYIWPKAAPIFSLQPILSWPFLDFPDADTYFRLVYQGAPLDSLEEYWGVFIYEIQYPPELKKMVQDDRPRPWLYEYATVGHLGSVDK